jgi:hypothetical protein
MEGGGGLVVVEVVGGKGKCEVTWLGNNRGYDE